MSLCLLEITKTNNKDKIFDKVILITINSSAPVSVTVCKELLMKLLNKCSAAKLPKINEAYIDTKTEEKI